jgi:hypothetical protein
MTRLKRYVFVRDTSLKKEIHPPAVFNELWFRSGESVKEYNHPETAYFSQKKYLCLMLFIKKCPPSFNSIHYGGVPNYHNCKLTYIK